MSLNWIIQAFHFETFKSNQIIIKIHELVSEETDYSNFYKIFSETKFFKKFINLLFYYFVWSYLFIFIMLHFNNITHDIEKQYYHTENSTKSLRQLFPMKV